MGAGRGEVLGSRVGMEVEVRQMIESVQPRLPTPVILDGRRLSRERAPGLAARAARVARERGRPPCLALVAFAQEDGRAPFAERKMRACEEAGVRVAARILSGRATTDDVRRAIAELLEDAGHDGGAPDGVFLEFPFPPGIDERAVMAAVPESLDIDVMTEGCVHRYLVEGLGPPPLTVSAGLELLDRYEVDVAGMDGLVVGDDSPFARMFAAALARRGARMRPITPADAPNLDQRVEAAQLVVAAAGRPGRIRAETLAPGAVAIDVGYYNPGGRGDIDLSGGIAHLTALAPVPGGIGPMTVSKLIERIIEFAE